MGLLADIPTGGSITALTPCIVHELTKADLRPILEARPHIAQELSRTLAQRLAAGRGLTTVEFDKTEPTSRLSARLSSQIRRLFELSGAN
jgi:CRP-like cAMP-binding protein